MQSGDEIPLTNLRLIGCIDEKMYLATNREGNVVDIYTDTYYDIFISTLNLESWHSTKYCIKTLYTAQLPTLIKKLEEEEDYNELHKLLDLIEKSINGLENIKKAYQGRNISPHNQISAWLDTIIYDYATSQIENIKKYLTNEGEIEGVVISVSDDSDNDSEHENCDMKLERGGIEIGLENNDLDIEKIYQT